MATTITALGSVPQKIVDAGTATITTSYTAQVTFDTHGAEYIGFMYNYTRGAETSLQCIIEALIRDTGEWVALPITNSLVVQTDIASAARAFQVRLSRDVGQLRIRAKTTGAGNATTRLEIWGMLSAPTFPIIGLIY